MFFESLIKTLTIEIYLFISISILLLYGVVYNTSLINNRLIIVNNISILSLFILFISIILIYNNPYINIITFNNTFITDNFINIIKIIILIGTISSILISLEYIKEKKIYSFEYVILIIFSTIAMLLMTSAYNLLSIYLALELQSLSFYVLASMKRNSEYSTEASFKYFILGVFASGFLLLGFSILYGITGIINIEQFYKLFLDNFNIIEYIGIYIAIALILIAFLFKIGAAPFHVWLPDVYEGSPMSVTAFFAITPKIVILVIMLRLFIYTFYNIIYDLNNLLIMSSIISMILASISALYQVKIIRLFAYSAIGHIGYILIGIVTSSIESIQSSLLYIIIYIIMTINIYSTIISLRSNNKLIDIKYIKEFLNLSKINPLLSISLALCLFSMAGIPPLAGFFSKLYIFLSAINSSMYLLTFIGILTSVISAVYYLYIIRIMYFGSSNTFIYIKQINYPISLILAFTLFFLVFFFFFSSSILMYTHISSLFLSI
jgi:proton-translocating NADH-quinone oxidoreductase chain N